MQCGVQDVDARHKGEYDEPQRVPGALLNDILGLMALLVARCEPRLYRNQTPFTGAKE